MKAVTFPGRRPLSRSVTFAMPCADGFNVVARAGTDVQEMHVVTDMTRAEMKSAIQSALNKLP